MNPILYVVLLKQTFFWLNFNLSVLDIGECEVVVLGLFFLLP